MNTEEENLTIKDAVILIAVAAFFFTVAILYSQGIIH